MRSLPLSGGLLAGAEAHMAFDCPRGANGLEFKNVNPAGAA
jgi:hypothetical protein